VKITIIVTCTCRAKESLLFNIVFSTAWKSRNSRGSSSPWFVTWQNPVHPSESPQLSASSAASRFLELKEDDNFFNNNAWYYPGAFTVFISSVRSFFGITLAATHRFFVLSAISFSSSVPFCLCPFFVSYVFLALNAIVLSWYHSRVIMIRSVHSFLDTAACTFCNHCSLLTRLVEGI